MQKSLRGTIVSLKRKLNHAKSRRKKQKPMRRDSVPECSFETNPDEFFVTNSDDFGFECDYEYFPEFMELMNQHARVKVLGNRFEKLGLVTCEMFRFSMKETPVRIYAVQSRFISAEEFDRMDAELAELEIPWTDDRWLLEVIIPLKGATIAQVLKELEDLEEYIIRLMTGHNDMYFEKYITRSRNGTPHPAGQGFLKYEGKDFFAEDWNAISLGEHKVLMVGNVPSYWDPMDHRKFSDDKICFQSSVQGKFFMKAYEFNGGSVSHQSIDPHACERVTTSKGATHTALVFVKTLVSKLRGLDQNMTMPTMIACQRRLRFEAVNPEENIVEKFRKVWQ